MRPICTACAVMCCLAMASPAIAADSQGRMSGDVSVRLVPKLSARLSAVARFGDAADGLYKTDFSGGLTYDLGHGWSATVAYTRVSTYRHGDVTHTEDRPSEQIGFRLFRIGNARFAGRVRLEQRFRSDGDETGWRLRSQVKLTLPVRRGSSTALIASHESFIQLDNTDWGQHPGYSRMRNAIGIKTALLSRVSIEADYLNQRDFGLGGARDVSANVGVLGLSITL